MAITVSGLKNANLQALQFVAGDFSNAGGYFDNGDQALTTRVDNPLVSGSVWTGDGLGEALTVVETNASAMTIGTARMKTGYNTALALHTALSSAQVSILTQLAVAQEKGYQVYDDGKVQKIGVPNDPKIPGSNDDASEIERTVVGALLFADTADQQAKVLFDRIGGDLPSFGDLADEGALAHNQGLVDQALDDLESSERVRAFWESSYPETIPVQDYDFDLKFVKNHPDLLLTLATFIPYLGWAARGVKLLELLRGGKKIGEEPAPPPPPQPKQEKVERPKVDDPKLKNFVDSNYKAVDSPNRTGRGTTADAVRKELHEGGDVGGKTHVTKARDQVRGLRNWLRKNPNASAHDRGVAETILKDLQDALNGN